MPNLVLHPYIFSRIGIKNSGTHPNLQFEGDDLYTIEFLTVAGRRGIYILEANAFQRGAAEDCVVGHHVRIGRCVGTALGREPKHGLSRWVERNCYIFELLLYWYKKFGAQSTTPG